MNDKISCVSIGYEEWQIFGTIWRYEDHKKLLELLLQDNQVILGGDILVYDNSIQTYSYSGSNWYYEGDSPLESNISAQKYLSGLEKRALTEELFLTFSIKKRFLCK